MIAQRHAEVACLGETMAQLLPLDGDIEQADRFAVEHGGAESNTAVGLARLGTSVAWVSRVGADALGRRVTRTIGDEGVDVSGVLVDPRRPTGLFTKDVTGHERPVTYFRANSAASMLGSSDLERALLLRPALLHTTGVTAALSEASCRSLAGAPQLCRRDQVDLSFDVNFRPTLWADSESAAAVLEDMGQRSDLLFVGLDEARLLWGSTSADHVRERFRTPRVLIVKDGPGEAVAFTDGQRVAVPAPRRRVVEPVGAGDAFAAGFIHSFLRDQPLAAALGLGHQMAGAVLASRSDVGDREEVAGLAEAARRDGGPASRTERVSR